MRIGPVQPVMQELRQTLDESDWWPRLDADQQRRVLAAMVVRDVAAGRIVSARGAPVEGWLGVVDGLVKISIDSADGRSVTLAGVPAGGWFGEGSVLKDESRRYDVIALRDSRIAVMPRQTFHWLIDISPGFSRFLLGLLNARLGQFIAALEHQRMLGPEARVARCLARLFDPQLYPSTRPRLRLSQSELGLLTGLSRQRVNQALRQLEALGLLEISYGGVTVVSVERLDAFEG